MSIKFTLIKPLKAKHKRLITEKFKNTKSQKISTLWIKRTKSLFQKIKSKQSYNYFDRQKDCKHREYFSTVLFSIIKRV